MAGRYSIISKLCLFWLFAAASLLAGPKDPVEGARFEKFISAQHGEFQNILRQVFPEEQGFIVTGPLDPTIERDENVAELYSSLRVIFPSLDALSNPTSLLQNHPELKIKKTRKFLEKAGKKDLSGYRGVMLELSRGNQKYHVQLQTINQLRWLIWARQNLYNRTDDNNKNQLRKYSSAVSDYLYEIDKGNTEAPEPKVVDFGLGDQVDLYAPAPDYVIQGYQNYKEYLRAHAEIVTPTVSEVLAYVPTESGLQRLKTEAPAKAFPNKEAPLLQEEFRKFIRRGGKMSSMRTLTTAAFDTLHAGEYFFAVGLSGTVRFGRELLREKAERIEKEMGQKPARANHAFLFVGEPILTAGAFFIENDGKARFREINTQSGHYFYSNITSTIREDVAERSNSYFLTIGHFFEALDSLGIEYQNVLLSKL